MGDQEESMVSAISSATSGLQDASIRLDVAAQNIANAATAGSAPSQVASPQGGGVAQLVTATANPLSDRLPGRDIATELLSLVLARLALEASIRALGASAGNQRTAVSLLA